MSTNYVTQIDELKRVNKELQNKLKLALDTVEVYTKDEIDALIKEITEATELTEEEVKEEIAEASPVEAVDMLKNMKKIVCKVKDDYKSVKSGSGTDAASVSKLSVGRWDAMKKEWVS